MISFFKEVVMPITHQEFQQAKQGDVIRDSAGRPWDVVQKNPEVPYLLVLCPVDGPPEQIGFCPLVQQFFRLDGTLVEGSFYLPHTEFDMGFTISCCTTYS
jgi:hypothetical protein